MWYLTAKLHGTCINPGYKLASFVDIKRPNKIYFPDSPTLLSIVQNLTKEFMGLSINSSLPYDFSNMRSFWNKWEKSGVFLSQGQRCSIDEAVHHANSFLNLDNADTDAEINLLRSKSNEKESAQFSRPLLSTWRTKL